MALGRVKEISFKKEMKKYLTHIKSVFPQKKKNKEKVIYPEKKKKENYPMHRLSFFSQKVRRKKEKISYTQSFPQKRK